VEDPELVFPVLVKEMEEQLEAATEAEAKAVATLKRCERDVVKQGETIDKYKNGALLALKKGEETTARESVACQIEAEKTAEMTQRNFEIAQSSCDKATASRKRIQEQLEELKAKKNEILTRARVAKVQKKIQRTVSGSAGSTDSILDAVAKLEAQIEETEAEIEIQAELTGEGTGSPSLEKRLDELGHEAEIENRLAEMRKQLAEEQPEQSGQSEE
jgi:phage shock protein A